MEQKVARERKMNNGDAKPSINLLIATKDVIERDIRLGLVTEDQLRFSIMAKADREKLIDELHAKGVSNRKIAKIAGCDESTVRAYLAAGNPAPAWLDNNDDGGRKAAVTRTAHEEIAKFAFNQPAEEIVGNPIRLGDFYQKSAEIKADSVDLVFTDPPYDDESIPLFEQMAEVAARVLKPGGSLVSYCGHMQLLKAGAALSKHLRFWQPLCCLHSGPFARLTEYGVVARFKPMLWFVKGTRSDKHTFIENVVTGQREKDHHEWQQAESDAAYFIELLSPKGGLVVDFFAGGGTTIIAAQHLGRNAIGYEIDAKHYSAAVKRIAGANDAVEAA